ncbi:cobalamin biosynthesis protein CobW [Parathermosynechococcus lividus PCC 6715]|uniref:Cobalamin biosynthesis protein CobW n=1 Tax=Parathermosynechococcus lividus PCC 6715 TaxID=1917166 RepID=A0A2D2Q1S6_PARLV|nr:cobalamin biosynthesis protein CobW [Thermostichus lividus]ATS18492.1 cobalamin biosynthesis protein CobW [Thermostichus lividus PCC 6715]
MAAKIPVTIITGFLGSGKTTLIRHLLSHAQGRRIAVIVNEFGDVGIDGDLLESCCTETAGIWELTNGCLCCTVQDEFLPTMQALLQRRQQIDHIVIETSGLALPKPLVMAFRWPEVRHAATVDGVVTVVDGLAFAAGQVSADVEALFAQKAADESLQHDDTPLEELFSDQLACADLVILTKTDQLAAGQPQHLVESLQAQLPSRIKVIAASHGQVPTELLLGFNAAVEEDLGQRPSHHDGEAEHDHDEEIAAVCLEMGCCDLNGLRQSLERLLKEPDIYRIKGFAAIEGKPMRLVVQGVGQRLEVFYDRLWQPHESRHTRLVVIGKGIDRQDLVSRLM